MVGVARLAPVRHRRHRLALVIPAAALVLLLTGAPAAGAADAPDSPPVLLRKSLFLTPIETAGTGLAPEVKIRLTVDPRGRVRDAEVLSITPSTEYDDLFRQAALETVGSWRYAPALSGGEPVATTLEWTVKFRPKWRRPINTPQLGLVLDDEAKLARVFTLPPQVQAERLQGFAALAERHLRPGSRRRVDSPRFVVITDSSDPGTPQAIDDNLEVVFNVLDELFRPALEPQPARYKLVVYVFTDRSSFEALAGELTVPEWANGFYAPPGLFAFHLETATVDRLLRVLIHETVHAYVDQHLVRPGFSLAPWLGEGLAEYFSNSEIRKGRLVPGEIREGKYVLDLRRGGAFRQTTGAGWSLDDAKQAVRAGKVTSVGTLVGLAPEAFYGEDIHRHYALSWLLVHFLRHGEPGWADGEFPTLLLYAAEGYPPDAAIEAVYGRAPEDLEAAFRAYVKGL